MLSRRDDEFPVEQLRDLLGLGRAMLATGEYDDRRLLGVLRDLQAALELAASAGPRTVGRRAAWARAERAVEDLGQLVKLTHGARAILHAGAERVRRAR